jgi:hypothetical protein
MDSIIPWLGIGALVGMGYTLNSTKTVATASAVSSRNGPPFYDVATNLPLRRTGFNAMEAALAKNPSGEHGQFKNGSLAALRFQELVREQSELARVKQWHNATDRSQHIIVQPNSRKPVYVMKW